MQNYTNPVVNQTGSAKSGILSQSAAPGIFTKINRYRDSGTYADEWLIAFKFLLGISAFFTLAFGWALHYQIFEPYVGPNLAHVSAFLFTAFIEISKIVIGLWVIRLLLFRLFDHTRTSIALAILGIVIFIGAFYWSYYNSTHGVSFASKVVSDWKINRQTIDPAKAAAPINSRIENTANTAKDGLGIKWKGTTTREGQKIAANSTAAILEQERQKTILLEDASREQARADASRDRFISGSSNLFALLGGKMEFFQILILFGMICCEKILYHRMQAGASQAPHSSNGNSFFSYQPINQNGNHVGNYRPIGFNTDQNGNVKAVAQTPQTVAQTTAPGAVVGANEAYKHYLSRLKKDVANFSNRHARSETVAGRLIGIMQEAKQFPELPEFSVLKDFIFYVNFEVLPGIGQAGQFEKLPAELTGWLKNVWENVLAQESNQLA